MLCALAVTAPFVPHTFLSHRLIAYAVRLYPTCNMAQTFQDPGTMCRMKHYILMELREIQYDYVACMWAGIA
jgi:hypothetical protein